MVSTVARNILAITGALILILLAGCSASKGESGAAGKGQVREAVAGQVTIVAERTERDGQQVFMITLDTHSVDLTRYDLARAAVLQDDRGNVFPAAAWVPSSDGGSHHMKGQLRFASPPTLANSQTRYLRLVIKDVGGVVSTLQWDLS
ncbi:MAG: hypothetical protein HYX90_09865 [Chloroflexi bacterium]|nr:hypothetical protein [Chloroflexota bacterium]